MNIKSKLLLPPLLGMALIVSSIHLYWEPLQVDRAREQYTRQLERLMRASESDVVRHLLERDIGSLYAAMEYQQSLHDGEWYGLALYDGDGKRLFPVFDTVAEVRPAAENLIRVRHVLRHSGENLGRIEVDVDWSGARALAHENFAKLNMLIIAMMILMLGVGYIGQHRILYMPLDRLRRSAARLAGGDFDTSLLPTSNDEVGRLSDTFRVMTERLRRSQQELHHAALTARESEARQRAIIESMGDGLLITGRDGVIRTGNPALTRMLGYAEGELDGQSLDRLMPDGAEGYHRGIIPTLANYPAMGQRVVNHPRQL